MPADVGQGLLKKVRTQLIETARTLLEAMVQDVSTVTGEKVVAFTLARSPSFRKTTKPTK